VHGPCPHRSIKDLVSGDGIFVVTSVNPARAALDWAEGHLRHGLPWGENERSREEPWASVAADPGLRESAAISGALFGDTRELSGRRPLGTGSC